MTNSEPEAGSGMTVVAPLREGPGTRIGPYKLLAQIGEGGFGSVFMAEQAAPVQRVVALKIIKLGMDTRQVVARFEQERQALAMMDHPHIARVLDAGATDGGRPYFVMELVKGEPIVAYCDKNNLSIRDRLGLFSQVCEAVQHAHTKGIIHRDLKPSNILVAVQDGRASAKVIDFGIAKATLSKLTEKTLFTEHRQLIGTPEYMSPEQAEGSMDIDTRTDVYSLGVLLYELLTGTTPFSGSELRSAAYAEVQRIIREVEPPTPSTRLSQETATIAGVAARRQTEPRRLGTMLRGDLDWIVMKAMEKDRQRRYETANGLAADIRRYLAGEAVLAAPPGAGYRFKKFVRRHKGTVTAGAVVAAALVLGMAGTGWQARRAAAQRDIAVAAREGETEQRRAAEAERDKATRVAEFMSATLEGVGPSVALGRDTAMLKEMMDTAATKIEQGDLKEAPEAELYLRQTIGRAYTDLSMFPAAQKMLEPTVALSRRLRPGDSIETANAIFKVAFLMQTRGDGAGAEPLFRENIAMRRRLEPGDNVHLATSINQVAIILQDKGDLAGAEALYREAMEMRKRLFPGDNRDVAVSLNSLARVLKAKGELAEAERLLRESTAMQKRLFAGDHPDIAVNLYNLGSMLQARGDLEGAETFFRESLAMMRRLYPGDHASLAVGIRGVAKITQARGDLDNAEPLFQEAMEMDRRLFKGDHPSLAADLQSLGMVLQARGKFAEAEGPFRESLEMNRRLLKGDHVNVATSLNNMASVLLSQSRAADAEPVAREATAMSERLSGKDAFVTANARMKLGKALGGQGRFAEGEAELLEAARVLATAKGVPPGKERQCTEDLVKMYEAWEKVEPGRGEKAEEWKKKLEELNKGMPAKGG